MNFEQEVVRGGDAERIMNDPLVQAALAEMEASVVDKIAACPPENEKYQQKLCMMLGVVRIFRQIFRSHIETGRMAVEQLADQKKPPRFGVF